MHRFSASISSLRGDKKATSPTLGRSGSSDASEFGSRNSNGLPPIPQEQRRGTQQQQQQQQQRRQSMQGSQQSSLDARRRSFAPSQSLNSPSASSSAPMQPQQARTVNSPTAGLHSLPAVAQLLNARKVYRAGYVWRLDGHPSSSPTGQLHPASSSATSPRLQDGNSQAQGRGPRFVRYYMRLEDCILCLWPDEGLREAQANGTVIHPTSMNLQDGFVVLADAKREWQDRAQQFSAPTPFLFVLNTAGNNSVTFATENEVELRRWINSLRLSIWERQRLENLYTAARLGIKEEQQLRPIQSAISFTNNGAKVGRCEGLLDVRLPGDTEWRRVYAVLTEPGNYSSNGRSSANGNGLPTSASTTSLASSEKRTAKKEKRKSFMANLLGGSSSSSKDTSPDANGALTSSGSDAHSSPVMRSYNTQLEDPNVGPTLALFGILSPSSSSVTSPSLRSSADFSSSTSSSLPASASISSIPSHALKLTRRPLCVINQVWQASAVWPENEALIPHARTFKIHGRMTWLEQEVLSYSQAALSASAGSSNAASGATANSGRKDPIAGFEDAMKRENRDLGKADNQVSLLCMLVGNESDASLPGPGHAVRANYKSDTGGELLSWLLGLYDAFRLHGRPDRMLYDPRNPLSPYFAQPSGPGRGGLYFDPALVEDLPQFQDTHPRAINDGFMRILIDRMTKAFGGGPLPGLSAPAGAGRISERDIEAYRRGDVPSQPQMGADRSSGSTPPVLPPIGESQDGLMGGTSGRSTPTHQNRNFEKTIPAQSMDVAERDRHMQQQYTNASMPGPSRTPNTTPPVNQQAMFPIRGQEPRNRSPLPEEGAYRQGDSRHDQQPFARGSHGGYGSPQPSYGTASPQLSRQGEQHSARSSPRVQAGMLRPGSASGSDVNRGHSPYLSEGGRDSSRLDASSRASNAASSNTREQESEMLAQAEEGGATDLSYYNSRKVRSADTASLRDRQSPEASSRAPSALSSTAAVPHMPGQYIPTPELNKSQQLHAPTPLFTPNNASASSMASPDLPPPPPPQAARASATDNQTHQRGQVSEQTLKEGDNSDTNDNSFGSGIAGTSTMAAMGSLDSSENQSERGLGDGRDRGASQGNSHKDSETALFNEPGALYAMSLADDHGDMSRDASTGSGHTQQPSLSKLILNRAAASGGVANGSGPSERSDSLASTANRTVGGRDAASRQNTYGSSAPISAAPTSASEYSQTGTMAESLSRSGAPSRSASQHLQLNQPSNLSKQISNTSSHHSSQNGGLPQPRDKDPAPVTHENRESKASTVSTIPSEGQDDYLAALSYVALTETHEPHHNSSPPRPTKNGKPVISIKTDPAQKTTTNGAKSRQPYSSTDTEPTSASSPMYDDPTSPDSYGTYADTAAPKMRVTNASPDKQARNMTRQSSPDRSRQTSTTSHATGPRKPGRGVPRVQKSGKKLGTWSSDEDDDDNDDKDSVDEEEEAERKKAEEEQRKAAEAAAIAEAERFKQERPREERPNHLRESTASSGGGSLRRSLPGLPGPSTDPYLNRATSPSGGMYPGQEDRSPYPQEMHYQQQYASNEANRGSMYSWQSQLPMPMSGGSMMSPPWQAQHQHRMSAGGSGSPYNSHSPYGHSPSPTAYGGGPAGINNQNTMLAYMPDNPETAAADGKAMRNAAVAQHGLLQTGIEQKQNKSAAQIEAMAKETGGPLLQLEHKAQMPQGGLVGAIASHERDRKRDGGLGATLTERDRERRMAEARQREMDQMAQRQAPFGGPGFGMQGFPAFGGMMPGMVPAPYGNTSDPAQMQQQIAMLAAQNAYLQAMASFNQAGLGNQQQNYMSPPFSPHMGPQAPYAGLYMGMAPPSQSPNQINPGQDGYGRGSPGAGGHQQHGRQSSRSQSDFFGTR